MKENENDDIIKGVLCNKDGTVDYVFDDAKLDEVIAPFLNENNTGDRERIKKCIKRLIRVGMNERKIHFKE